MQSKLLDLLQNLGEDVVAMLEDSFSESALEEWMTRRREALNMSPADAIRAGKIHQVKDLCRRLYAIEGEILKSNSKKTKKKAVNKAEQQQ